jgi:hypothetical protein
MFHNTAGATMTQQQLELHRFLNRLATDIAYRGEVMPYEVEVLRAIRQHIAQNYPEAKLAIAELTLAADIADFELANTEQNPFAVLEIALKLAWVAGALYQMSQCPTTQQVPQC